MNAARFVGIAALAIGVLVGGLSYFRKDVIVDSHRHLRQVVLHHIFSRFDQPIVIVGDSITEASTLPRTFCGRPVVNAGLDGASTASDLGTWLIEVLGDRRATAILVALGTNDVLQERSVQEFEADYTSLLALLAGATDHLALLGIPAIEMRPGMSPELLKQTAARVDAFNAMLRALAKKSGAAFTALPPMDSPHTIDGVHLDASGYAVWDAAVLKGVSSVCSTH